MVGSTTIFTLTPCGPDCTHVDTGGGGWDLHQQGNTWTGSNADSTQTLDNSSLISSLILTIQYADNPNVVIGLTKNG